MDPINKSKYHKFFIVSHEKNFFTYYSIVKNSAIRNPKKYSVKDDVYVQLPSSIALCKIVKTSNEQSELMPVFEDMKQHYHSLLVTYEAEKVHQAYPEVRQSVTKPKVMVSFGPNKTIISEMSKDRIRWSDYKTATCDLLFSLFDKQTLATHSINGAWGLPELDSRVIEDITISVTQRFHIEMYHVHSLISRRCRSLYKKEVRRLEEMRQARLRDQQSCSYHMEVL